MLAVVLVFPILCLLVGWVYMPVFHNLQLVSSYEYLELRFNHSVKMMCSGVYTISMMLYLSIVVYTPALALQTVVGLDVDVSCACIFLVCVFYTSVRQGGTFKAGVRLTPLWMSPDFYFFLKSMTLPLIFNIELMNYNLMI